MDYTVHGILQDRILEWITISFSRGSSQPRSPTLQADSLPAELPEKLALFLRFFFLFSFADKARDFIGKERLGGECQGKGNQEDCSATWLLVSGFMVIGFVSGLSLVNHSDLGSFLVVHTSLRQDGFQRGGFWEVGRTRAISF